MKNAYELKRDAIDGLTGHWGIAIGAGLVASALIGGATGGANVSVSFPVNSDTIVKSLGSSVSLKLFVILLAIFAVVFLISMAISIVYSLFSSVIETGYARFNIDLVDYLDPSFGSLFSYFRYWKNVAIAGLLRQLFITLGTLLFIVPGILISYNYAMVPYLLADDPTLTPKEALERSKQLMYGHRWRLFCVEMSFFGWIVLTVFTFGIGVIWLNPYMSATRAAFYKDLTAERPIYATAVTE